MGPRGFDNTRPTFGFQFLALLLVSLVALADLAIGLAILDYFF